MTDKILWPLESHTLGKHAVLKEYLKAWFPILSRHNGRVLFIDGFAGPGRYQDGEEGSPLIALRSLHQHSAKAKIGEVVFIFIEADKKRAANLEAVLADLRGKGEVPGNCSVQVHAGHFDDSMSRTLDALEEQKKQLAPAFVMIDPFGVSDTPMSVVRRLLQNSRLEVYVSFMYEFLNRFKGTPEFEPHLDALFGTEDWRASLEIKDAEARKTFLFDLYETQLRGSGATHVVRFELLQANRLKYAIFFATKHELGADRMKQAVWKVAPTGDFSFRGGRSTQLTLEVDSPDFRPLQAAIAGYISSKTPGWVTVEQVESYVIAETDYHSGQFKTNALKVLEKNGAIEADPTSRKKAFTYPPGTRLRAKGTSPT